MALGSVAHRSRRQGLRAAEAVLASALRAALTAALRCAAGRLGNPAHRRPRIFP